jgi:hypothetical protein
MVVLLSAGVASIFIIFWGNFLAGKTQFREMAINHKNELPVLIY